MALPEFSMRQLLEAGVHFGHQTQRWNPRMGPYHLRRAQRHSHHGPDTNRSNAGRALSSRFAIRLPKAAASFLLAQSVRPRQPIAEAAEKCAQYYMNHRWLGGTLTNWQTVSKSIQRLKSIDEQIGAQALKV